MVENVPTRPFGEGIRVAHNPRNEPFRFEHNFNIDGTVTNISTGAHSILTHSKFPDLTHKYFTSILIRNKIYKQGR